MACGSCTSCEGGPCQGLLPETDLPTNLPLVVYDGDCTFCRRWLKRYESVAPADRLAWSPYQKAAGQFPGIPEENFTKWLHLVQPGGDHVRGAAAVFEIMSVISIRSWPLHLYRLLPPFRAACDGAYRLVADHRRAAGGLSAVLWGRIQIPSTTLLTRRVFLRLLGLIYLIAFLSIGWQADGLFGPDGLMPYEARLGMVEAFAQSEDTSAFLLSPTLLWFGGPGLLEVTWILGLAASVALILGLIPMASMAVAWFAYLSFVNVGSPFMNFQWDAMLLEVGFIAIFWAPFTWRLNGLRVRRPSTVLRWMLLWLLLRFMFVSGWLKLASQDAAWWDLTALDYHYWTQPLPWWPAWYAWQLPMWWQKCCCLIMFIIELGVPFLLLFPRMPRLVAFLALGLLQLGILLTGNYGFFNLLTLVLCIVVLDDSQLLWMWPRRVRGLIRVGLARAESPPRRVLNTIVACILLSLSIPITLSQLQGKPFPAWSRTVAPWHVVNGYGLFRVMTKTRPEITIEGSNDGVTWEPYIFRWKPGPLDRRPAFCQPGMPRLDWQMWFDALAYEHALELGMLIDGGGLARGRTRFANVDGRQVTPAVCTALAAGNPRVLQLLKASPFPDGPPAFIRWHLDQYRFTTSAERSSTGHWWTRERLFTSGAVSSALLTSK